MAPHSIILSELSKMSLSFESERARSVGDDVREADIFQILLKKPTTMHHHHKTNHRSSPLNI